jgi:hypothetical protein
LVFVYPTQTQRISPKYTKQTPFLQLSFIWTFVYHTQTKSKCYSHILYNAPQPCCHVILQCSNPLTDVFLVITMYGSGVNSLWLLSYTLLSSHAATSSIHRRDYYLTTSCRPHDLKHVLIVD